MESGGISGEATALDVVLDQLSTDLDHLVKLLGDGVTDPVALVTYAQRFEQIRNRCAVVDHRVIGEAERLDLPSVLCQGRIQRVLTAALSISRGEAARRVRAAAAVGPRTTMLGEALEPVRPHLAAAQRSGEVSAEKVAIVERALSKVDHRGFDLADVEAGEQLLAAQARLLPPEDLKTVADRVVAAIDPDGTVPDDQLNDDRRFFHLQPTKDGAYAGEFRLTGATGVKLQTLLAPLTRARVDESGEIDALDLRTLGQRRHDALEEVCDRLLRAGSGPDVGGIPTTVVVTIDWDDLLNRCGFGTTTDGTIISAESLLEMADEAQIIPAVLNAAGAVLSLGQTRRLASRSQTLALIARDGGCSFPGCSHPPEFCERHHILEWANGGMTDLDNLTLLCRYHHHNFLARGWTVTLDAGGTPEWRPPRWVDPKQKPMINSRVSARLLTRRAGRTRAP
jgi:hypothetical protein